MTWHPPLTKIMLYKYYCLACCSQRTSRYIIQAACLLQSQRRLNRITACVYIEQTAAFFFGSLQPASVFRWIPPSVTSLTPSSSALFPNKALIHGVPDVNKLLPHGRKSNIYAFFPLLPYFFRLLQQRSLQEMGELEISSIFMAYACIQKSSRQHCKIQVATQGRVVGIIRMQIVERSDRSFVAVLHCLVLREQDASNLTAKPNVSPFSVSSFSLSPSLLLSCSPLLSHSAAITMPTSTIFTQFTSIFEFSANRAAF